MKKISYILFLFTFSAHVAAAYAQDAVGYLSLISDAQLRIIIIDDSAYAYQDKIKLAAGPHRIVVPHPDQVSYQELDFAETVTIRPGEEEKVEVNFETLTEINSYPAGAEVSVDSELLGITPFYLSLSKHKEELWRFRKPGHQDISIHMSDSMLLKNYVFISLQPNIINRSNNQNQFVNLEWQEKGPHKFKNAILITQGLGIAFGAGAAYYKKKADDSFEKAKVDRRLGNIPQRERHLDKTKKYDRYAAIGFIGMQINVAALIYFLFQSR